MATIYFGTAVSFAGAGNASVAQALGYAAAHELFHLILQNQKHSSDGIMRSHWSKETAQAIRQGRLEFSDEQKACLRRALRAAVPPAKPIERPNEVPPELP